MSTSSVSSTSNNFFVSSSSTSTTNSSIDFDSFLKILSAELKYQDPSDPVSNTEYVSQMAQLSSLSQLENVYAASSNSAAFGMIGKEVAYQTTDSSGKTTDASGTVKSVFTSNGTTYLNVDGTAVPLKNIVEVADSSSSTTST